MDPNSGRQVTGPRQNTTARRDYGKHAEHFFWKKFGYKWKQKLRSGEIPQEQIDKLWGEFKGMMGAKQ
jgi:hypothetical protein